MPEITKSQPGTFCWFELGTTDASAARTFYSSLFDWTTRENPMGPGMVYSMLQLGGKDVGPVLAALERNKRYIRGELAEAVNLKFAPDIRFLADETFDEADRIERLLASDKVRQDLEK